MARIPDELIGCVFFLYPSLAEAKANAPVGASGFFVGIEWESNQLRQHLYAVTNKHCITKCSDHVVLRATKIGGDLEFIESDPIEWHPLAGHDVSVFPISPAKAANFQYVSSGRFSSPDDFKIGDGRPTSLGLGDKVFMVGRFVSDENTAIDQPSARFGNLSLLASPVRHPAGYDQESFVVEMRSISGYSGSPTFIYWEFGGGHLDGIKRTMIHSYLGLLGIEWGHIPVRLPVLNKHGVPLPDETFVKSHTSMSGVVPVWRLQELLNSKGLKEQRMKDEKDEMEKLKKNPTAEADFASEDPTGDKEPNPRHLEDFTRLVDVAARKRPQGG
jgi:hypothetical protein